MTEITILASHPINVFKESDLSSAMKDSLRDGDPAEQIIEGLAKSEVLVVDVAALWKNWGNLNRAFNDEQKSDLLRVLQDLFTQPRKGGANEA